MLGTLWCEEQTLRVNERAGAAGQPGGPGGRGPAGHVLLRVASGSGGPRAEGQLRHVGTSRLVAAFLVQRGSHRRHLPGHLRLPGAGGHHRAAVPGPGHSWSVRARVRDRAGGPRGQRRDRAGGQPGRVHADARAVPGHPRLQRRARRRPGRRDRDHPVAQPAGGRRVQVQPARRRPGRLADHLGHPGPRQRAAGRRPARGAPDPLRGGPARVHDGHVRLPGRVRRATAGRGRPGHHPRGRASGSAPTRWAAPASRTGPRSPSGTGWT